MFLPELWRLVLKRLNQHLKRNDVEGAIGLAKRYIRMRPRDPNAYLMLQWLLVDYTEVPLQEIELVLREGMKRCRGHAGLAYSVGQMLVWRYQEAPDEALLLEARQLFDYARDQDPSSPRPYLGHAWASAASGDLEGARELAGQTRRRIEVTDFETPDGYETFHNLIRLLLRIPGSDETAIDWLEQTAALEASGANPHIYLSFMFEAANEAKSQSHMEQARKRWRGKSREFDEYVADQRERFGRLPENPFKARST